MHLRKQYVHLIRNKTLMLESDNTRICSQHFEGGQKLHRQHLLSIFPWTESKEKRRELKRLEVPRARECSKSKVPSVSSAIEPATTAMTAEENRIEEESLVSTSAEIAMDQLSFVDEATQTENVFEEDERERKIQELNFSNSLMSQLKIIPCIPHRVHVFGYPLKHWMKIYKDLDVVSKSLEI